METKVAQAGPMAITLSGDLAGMTAEMRTRETQPGVYELVLGLKSATPAKPRQVKLSWLAPVVDCYNEWYPGSETRHGLTVQWAGPQVSRATSGAPVKCLHSAAGINRMTFAVSDALNPVGLHAGVQEETACFQCHAEFFREAAAPVSAYEVTLRLDLRSVAYHTAIAGVEAWWAGQADKTPSPVPDIARLPMYSTWYSFHQSLDVARVTRQCELAKELGCETVIVDDGWETLDSNRGFAYCGDWVPERTPDMVGFVRGVHAAGLKFILWYAVPLVGKHSQLFKRFGTKVLSFDERNGCGTLDPRYPEIREYLIERYERAVREWDLDGLKLDFVDAMVPSATTPAFGPGMDTASIYEGADLLLSNTIARLRKIKPEIMIEFRQTYIGPLMRKYGNLFRAADCPNDALMNRVRTIELRLLSGNTAVHADMLMWHPDEPVESAALQFLAILFAVPQVSVMLDSYPKPHIEMLRFYLRFWREHRAVLLDGALTPLHVDANYPVVLAETQTERLAAVYSDCPVPVARGLKGALWLVNATRGGRLILDVAAAMNVACEVFDCCGKRVAEMALTLNAGANTLAVPPAGLAVCRVK